jgi:hypothetical protein
MAVVALQDLIAELCERHAAYLQALGTPDARVPGSKRATLLVDHALQQLGSTVRSLARVREPVGLQAELDAVRLELGRCVAAEDPGATWQRNLLRRLSELLPQLEPAPVGRHYPRRLLGREKVRKLGAAQVREIRALAAAGRSAESLAEQFGVCESTVGQVVRRATWQSVP